MKLSNLKFLLLVIVIVNSSCGKEDEVAPIPVDPKLLSLNIELNGSTFLTEINGQTVSMSRPLPFGTTEVSIQYLSISENSTANIKVGDKLLVSQSPFAIIITASDGKTNTYTLEIYTKTATAVDQHGLLQVSGNKVVDQHGESVSFAGNSFFWSNDNWGGERFYKRSVVSWLKLDWGATIVRAAMGVEDAGGYIDNKTANKNRLKTIVDAALAEGLYVIIDWHSHHAEDNVQEAVAFFEEMATLYGDQPNIIYEIYNEPLNISWSDVLKPYAETVIEAIRAIDPDNLIVVGTPEWSQRVDLAAADPITTSTNIAYTLHFYTVHHQQWLRDRASAALANGIALFVTEWGSVGYTQNDPETDKWIEWCNENKISHCNWSVHDKLEEWSIVKPGANTSGSWREIDLTEAGKLARKIIRIGTE